MPALELAAFQARPLPDNAIISNSWNLNLCTQRCNIVHSVDRTRLDKHNFFKDTPMDQLTFGQCTPAFVECNTKCQKSYNVEMRHWPPSEASLNVHTSSNLTICINYCNMDASNDQRKVIDSFGDPDSFARDAVFANCHQGVSKCTQGCSADFNKELRDFQKELEKERKEEKEQDKEEEDAKKESN
jgi:hypothetical protein